MKKGLKFTKEQLEDLYIKQKLSLIQIGRKFDCHDSNILYWLKKFNIKRRPAYFRKVDIPKELLEGLYINKKLSSLQIAKRLGTVNSRTIRKKLKKFGIKTRSLSEAGTKKFKKPFLGNLIKKAYFLGLRAGDFHAKRVKKCIRVQTTTTHEAQLELLRNSFRDYGEFRKYLSKNKTRTDEWFIYVDLDVSFDFLLKKPGKVPPWILEDKNNFFSFLAAYIDCEGCWKVAKSHEKYVRFFFDLGTNDKLILDQIKGELNSMGYHPCMYLDKKKGERAPYGHYSKNIYNIILNRKIEIIRLINNILPLSKHSEKIRKMEFIFKNRDKKWHEVEKGWSKLRKDIKGELLKNI